MNSKAYVALINPETIAAVEEYPTGAAVLVGLVVFALVCWVAVAWIKHRRR